MGPTLPSFCNMSYLRSTWRSISSLICEGVSLSIAWSGSGPVGSRGVGGSKTRCGGVLVGRRAPNLRGRVQLYQISCAAEPLAGPIGWSLTRVDGPSAHHSNPRARQIWRGADHAMLSEPHAVFRRPQSEEIRFDSRPPSHAYMVN